MQRRTPHPSVLLLRLAALGALAFSVAALTGYLLRGTDLCAPGGGCDQVRYSAIGQLFGDWLPILGVLAYTTVFAGTLFETRGLLRFTAVAAILGGLAAAAFIALQAIAIGAWCWLCVGVDSFGILAAAAGAWMLAAKVGRDEGSRSIASPWWGAWWLAWAPLAYALTFPDPPIHPAVHALYDPDADVNVVEMADFECPYCRAMNPVLESVLAEVDGDVNLVRVMTPLSFHQHARGAAAAYFCAQRQERGEPMAHALFETEDLTEDGLVATADHLELDVDAFRACLDDDAIDARIDEDIELARRAGMEGLPSVYIGDRVIVGFMPEFEADYRDAVRAELRGEGRRIAYWPGAALLIIAGIAAALGALIVRRRAKKSPPDPEAPAAF